MSNRNIDRINKNLVPKGTFSGVTVYQDVADNKLYYKDVNGRPVELLEPSSETITSMQTDIATNTNGISALAYTYTEITISVAEIENLSGGKQLLPAAGAGKYYDWYGFLEYTHNGTSYTGLSDYVMYFGDNWAGGTYPTNGCAVYMDGILGGTSDGAVKLSPSPMRVATIGNTMALSTPQALNKNLIIQNVGADPFSGGDGTILVKIYSRIITAGTEL